MKSKILLSVALTTAIVLTGCSETAQESSSSRTQFENFDSLDTSSAKTESESEIETETETTVETTVTTTTEPHISPIETISYSMGYEKGEINEILDYETNKTYKAKLSELADDGDSIESFTFVFYASDGVSDIGSYTGACGISVDEDCPSATDGWYQSDDFEVSVNGAYVEIEWEVPTEIRDYINISDKSYIQIGYWWGGVKSVRLESIICEYSTSFAIPVDNTKTVECNKILNYSDEKTKQVKLSLDDFIDDGEIPQYFEFEVSGDTSFKKISGAFGISVDDDCPSATDDYWYQSKNFAVVTDSSETTLYWKVPDEIKEYISDGGDIMLGYWWSESAYLTLKNVTVKSSIGEDASSSELDNSGTPEGKVVNDVKTESVIPDNAQMKDITSQQIVEDMRLGWNLGNTLDCYDVEDLSTAEYETGWGNPVTAKAMIDTVKEAGFNAVRIPVSWNDHMNGDTIDTEWLDRVNEVVDYVIDNDMYAIINVHHDDYTWLNPTTDDEEEVKARLVKIWKQISERFKDYDQHLLFEGMNEPRVVGSDEEWTGGTAEEQQVINDLFDEFVKTVRATGGNNTYRHLIITSYGASITEDAVKAVEVPDDNRIIVSIHYYSPWNFSDPDSKEADWGTDSDKKALDEGFEFLKETFIDKGIPVIIGEFGSVNKKNYAIRTAYTEYYIKSAKEYGITCFLWDNGVKNDFGQLNRTSLTWYFPDIINSAVKASE